MKSKADNNNKYLDDLVNRVQKAESHADCEELRVLLKDVREEVQHLNKVVSNILCFDFFYSMTMCYLNYNLKVTACLFVKIWKVNSEFVR